MRNADLKQITTLGAIDAVHVLQVDPSISEKVGM
jgi:hypothetical protein